ncbi:hypothetical protein BDV24DRAFT_167659 [Aspergillus arachidicola]|uniref:Enoyl reductase (ER) domain-containing protein n=1 Tax=Aspergillus arachidicola TaxID=656916 RepID=A0A5N6XVD0_9EURO|nr:hypothetical protein BDV24DRAFT_167659 [Aspergillus arachidicola]
MLVRKLGKISWEEAAGIPETWMTAYQAVFLLGGFKPGQSILWHADASSVSIAGIQLAKAAGAKGIYATAGSREKLKFLVTELGVTGTFNYRDQDRAGEFYCGLHWSKLFPRKSERGRKRWSDNPSSPDGRAILPDNVTVAPLLLKRIGV